MVVKYQSLHTACSETSISPRTSLYLCTALIFLPSLLSAGIFPLCFAFLPSTFQNEMHTHTHTHTSMCFVYVYISCGSHTGMRQHSAPARICHISPGLCLILLFNCSCYFFPSSSSLDCLTFCCSESHESHLARDCSEQCMLIPVLTYKRWENVCSPRCTSLCAQGKMRHLKGICIPVSTPLWRTLCTLCRFPATVREWEQADKMGVGVFKPDLAQIHHLLCQSGHQVTVHLSNEVNGFGAIALC